MPTYNSDTEHQPKGDHNRRLSLGLDIDAFAAEAGLTVQQVREFEFSSIDHGFDENVARRYEATLDRLEANPPASQVVKNR
jgi:hypothetical protein